MADVTFRGLAELDETLRALPFEIERQIARAALRDGAALLRDGVERRVPRDTGQAAENIQVDIRKDARYGLKAVIGPTRKAFYLMFLEFGTRFIAPRSIFRATVDGDGQLAVAAFAISMRARIESAVKRLAKRAA